MPRSRRAAFLRVFVSLCAVASSLVGCLSTVATPPPAALAGKSLPEVVEAYMTDLPGPSPKLFLTTEIRDRHGYLLGEYWEEGHRYWTPLNQMAPALLAAIVATEDKTFYSNPGYDWAAIARAVMENSQNPDLISGASTITQQLARNIAFPFEKRIERSIDRKMSETWLAQDLTQRFSKDQILEMYLNVVYFGHLAYGAEAAARAYFGKPAADLSLAESALLAALPQSPVDLDPFVDANRPRAKQRQGVVLALMAKAGAITQDQAEAAYREPLKYQSLQVPRVAPYFMDYVRQNVETQYGQGSIGRLGLVITTTLDIRVQQLAEDLVRKQVDALRKPYNLSNAALVALKPATGEIIAMVGGADYYSKANGAQVNVTVRLRQPGSAIKPVLYSLAFSNGLSPADVVWDIPTDFKLDYGRVYHPTNYDNRYHGPLRLRQALANSYNVPAVKVLNQMGVPNMIKWAHALGVVGLDGPPEQYGLAITLGGAEVTLLSLTNAFATLANGGVRAPSTPVIQAANRNGQIIDGHGPVVQVLDPRVAYLVTSVLSDNEARTPAFGANNPLHLTRPAAAKTGTTSDWRDNWTVGYTPYLAVGVWAGNNDGTPMRNTTGLTGAAPIWHDFLETIFKTPALEAAVKEAGEPLDFPRPAGLVEEPICVISSLNGGSTCPKTRSELFLDPGQPLQPSLAATLALSSTQPLSRPKPAATRLFVPNVAANGAPTPQAAGLAVKRPVDPGVAVRNLVRVSSGWCITNGGGQPEALLRAPRDPQEAQQARNWASAAHIPIEPPMCPGEQAAEAQPDGAAVIEVTATPPAVAGAASTPQPPELTPSEAVPSGQLQTVTPIAPAEITAIPPTETPWPATATPVPASPGAPTATEPADSPTVAFISAPAAGSAVRGVVQVEGTAVFNLHDIEYYRVEYGAGGNPQAWNQVGNVHGNQVGNGWLESWDTSGLAPGTYALRIVLVERNGHTIATAPTLVEVRR